LGACGKERHTRTQTARRSGSLRRETQDSPVSSPRGQTLGRGRGASLGKMLGTREARVLVVEAVGSRSWSERIELALPELLQGRSEQGELARRKPQGSADADWGRRPFEGGRQRGAVKDRAQSEVLGRRGAGSHRRPSETVRKCHAGTSQGRHRRLSLSGVFCEEHVGSVWLKGYVDLRKQAVGLAQRKAP